MSRLTIQEVIEHCERTVRTIEKQHENYQDWFELKPTPISMKRYWEHKQTAEWLKELQHYKDLEEQGRLIELPCKVGERLYFLTEKGDIENVLVDTINYALSFEGKIGKGFYRTIEAAEARLAEMEGE